MPRLAQLAADLSAGRTTSEELVEECLARIADPDGEGARAFLAVDADAARRAARAMDTLRAVNAEPSPYAGIPVSVKDLFDVRGQVTRAGSVILDGSPAERDATAVTRWRRAGLVVLGRTNMTEFAFSGLGLNPHYGTPANPWDREARRIPGGSSSGAAVSVADGMAHAALGTDTGGSCRIPAALCGLVGFKPTQRRIPREGVVPLAPSLDTVGVLGRSIVCCAALDALLADADPLPLHPLTCPPRLALPRNYFLEGADPVVTAAFDRAVERLADAGAILIDLEVPELDEIPEMSASGGIAAAEAFAWHHDLLADHAAGYDPRVLVRILRGGQQSARELLVLREWRERLIARVATRLARFDAFLCPTVPLTPPRIAALEDDEEYARVNVLMLRNPTVINLLDGSAASLPMHVHGEPPAGLMVSGFARQDRQVLEIAAWIEERL
jgi:aspartyl-tRNA(Asn)/glutamyl-tRNA(Gln) amidotransferase subunit A